VTEFNSK